MVLSIFLFLFLGGPTALLDIYKMRVPYSADHRAVVPFALYFAYIFVKSKGGHDDLEKQERKKHLIKLCLIFLMVDKNEVSLTDLSLPPPWP